MMVSSMRRSWDESMGLSVEGLPISASSRRETRNSSYSWPGFEPAIIVDCVWHRNPAVEMRRQNVRTLSLVVGTFTYLLVGAAVFDAIESSYEQTLYENINYIRARLVQKYNISERDFDFIEQVIIERRQYKGVNQWEFPGALYFVTVVVAMIGYGHSTPSTVPGKAFCIMYAGFGIPLGMVMFQSIGERLNKFTSIVIKKVKRFLGCANTEATEVNQLMVTGTLSIIVMTTGAAVFSEYEGWNYLDSFYYCFITLTTIGFGDFVALQKDEALTTKPGYVVLSLVFILFGLTVVAACINLLVLRFMTINSEDARAGDLEMQGANQSVVTQDGELMAVNGKLLSANYGGGAMIHAPLTSSVLSVTTVCSCTCFPKHKHFSKSPDMRHRSPSRISNLLVDPQAVLTSSRSKQSAPYDVIDNFFWNKRASI
ncbi:Potassium channel domain [Trinorchestia longiramus]|nr:Potassium channel domain [Trinorchestia longiramus]